MQDASLTSVTVHKVLCGGIADKKVGMLIVHGVTGLVDILLKSIPRVVKGIQRTFYSLLVIR